MALLAYLHVYRYVMASPGGIYLHIIIVHDDSLPLAKLERTSHMSLLSGLRSGGEKTPSLLVQGSLSRWAGE